MDREILCQPSPFAIFNEDMSTGLPQMYLRDTEGNRHVFNMLIFCCRILAEATEEMRQD